MCLVTHIYFQICCNINVRPLPEVGLEGWGPRDGHIIFLISRAGVRFCAWPPCSSILCQFSSHASVSHHSTDRLGFSSDPQCSHFGPTHRPTKFQTSSRRIEFVALTAGRYSSLAFEHVGYSDRVADLDFSLASGPLFCRP
jgi:hypothetical protein